MSSSFAPQLIHKFKRYIESILAKHCI